MKLHILGFSCAGKSTAAEILAELLHTKYANTSDQLIADYAASAGLSVEQIMANKEAHRQDIFKYGRMRQEQNPLYPADEQLKWADVITGSRTPGEIKAARAGHLYDLIIWINRPGYVANQTDKLTPNDADVVIDNDGTIADLRQRLQELLKS